LGQLRNTVIGPRFSVEAVSSGISGLIKSVLKDRVSPTAIFLNDQKLQLPIAPCSIAKGLHEVLSTNCDVLK
jgi:hypothetical protein